MKKIVSAIFVFFLIMFVHGLTAAYSSGGEVDQRGNAKPSLWRSTRTSVAESMVLVATGSIHLHTINVESATVNSESWVAIYNSTTGPSGGYNPNVSTAAFCQTAIAESNTGGKPGMRCEYDILLSSGMVVSKSGLATVNILWEFTDPYAQNLYGSFQGRVPALIMQP